MRKRKHKAIVAAGRKTKTTPATSGLNIVTKDGTKIVTKDGTEIVTK